MIKLPILQAGSRQTQMTTTFHGYNHTQVISDGQMYDTKNLSADGYPVLSLRKKRAYSDFETEDVLSGINGRDQLTFILGKDVYYDNYPVGLQVDDDPATCPKQIVNFGAYVCIWPDKKYFNTVKLTEYGDMERLFSLSGTYVSLMMCRGDGTNYDMTQITVSSSAPSNPTNGKLWIDQSGDVDRPERGRGRPAAVQRGDG